MATIAEVLKQQIADLTDKAVKKHLADVRAMAAQQERTIARLKSQVSALESQLSGTRRAAGARGKPLPAPSDGRRDMRFQAKGIVSLRARLGLSRAKFGKLVGVSGISVYNWERRKARPRPALLSQIAELRHLGKKEAHARLGVARSAKTARKNPPIGGRQKKGG